MRQAIPLNISLILLTLALLAIPPCSSAKERQDKVDTLKNEAIKVFLDCRACDWQYTKTEITFVNYVRDRKDADVHILVTTQRTGSGGQEYTMTFIGMKKFEGMTDTLKYISSQTDTEDDVRREVVRVLKMGLIPYVAKTPLAEHISISFLKQVEPTSMEDRWNYWVFRVGLNGSLSGQKLQNFTSISGYVSADRVTPEMKIDSGFSANFNESNFTLEDSVYSSSSSGKDFNGLVVKSINDHWSVGAWLSGYSSTYSNTKFAVAPVPAIEYNLFPYSESTRRQVRFLYRAGYRYVNYYEETIYDKTSEHLWFESLSASLGVKEPWGNMNASFTASHYFHDLKINRVELWTSLNLRIFRGLNLDVHGGLSMIHDQLSLPKAGATPEEILLRRKELATTYSYSASIGFSYTFGSVFSNVVNPRFGRY